MTPAVRGSWLVAAAATCWGAQPTLAKLLFVERLGPVELSALRAPMVATAVLLPPTRAAIMLTLEPAASIAIAWVVLGEPLGAFEAAGGLAILAGVLAAQRQP